MKKPIQDDALDAFWRGVQDNVRADDELRIREEALVSDDDLVGPCEDEMSDAEIERIVAHATQSGVSESVSVPVRRSFGWMQLAAACLIVTFLAAGVTVSIWPEGRFSNGGNGKAPISFSESALMLTDPGEEVRDRIAGLVRIHGSVSYAVQTCIGVLAKSEDTANAALRPVAAAAMDELSNTLSHGVPERGPHPTLANVVDLSQRIMDTQRPLEAREADLRILANQVHRGVRCLVTAAESGESGESGERWKRSVSLMRARLLDAVAPKR